MAVGVLGGALRLALQCLKQVVVAEAWLVNEAAHELAAFHAPTPLYVEEVVAGEVVKRVVDLELARAFSSQHQLSHRLASKAAGSGSIEWCTELSGDALMEKLKFGVEGAVAVPVIVNGQNESSPVVPVVLVFYLAKPEQVRGRDEGARACPAGHPREAVAGDAWRRRAGGGLRGAPLACGDSRTNRAHPFRS